MDEEEFLKEQLISFMRRRNCSPEQAAADYARGFRVDIALFDSAIIRIREEAERNKWVETLPGAYIEGELPDRAWYTGPLEEDRYWPPLRQRLEHSGLRAVVDDIDSASTKVVSHLAAPDILDFKKRGLVVGYVQSGKTANYTAVMAKAADAGYKFFIVLAGMHNNLRRQTQIRVSRDLGAETWHNWTTPDADFGNTTDGTAVLQSNVPSLAVVKKNANRLRSLKTWLQAIPSEIRRRVPILLLDDEADQATPNTVIQHDNYSAINRLIRDIWAEIPTGTYLGYTATPFANVFMDPDDEDELYPANFIIDLPRPDNYFGAERVFGREPLKDADEPDPGLAMVRRIDDADGLRPPSKKEERWDFDPELPQSLRDAILWFVVATAIRHARGQDDQHSSMLIHTTHYVDPHFHMKSRVEDLVHRLRANVEAGDLSLFEASFHEEAHKVEEEASEPLPTWNAVAGRLGRVLKDVRVVVDNGSSDDRLDYDGEDGRGNPRVETVIAIGGGTLSRGLTLEGLVVSYFTRTSNTYDTLLQMGRWFGFRPGYEDLPRIWIQEGLDDDYRFLALVEEEIRQDMRHLELMKVTPRELGIRVRAHPGRLAIVARNKMGAAEKVRVTFSGLRLQTLIFDETNAQVQGVGKGVLDHNLDVTRKFLESVAQIAALSPVGRRARWIARDVPSRLVLSLIRDYQFHPDQGTMRPNDMAGWIEQYASDRLWNVVIVGRQSKTMTQNQQQIVRQLVDLGVVGEIPPVNRAPLATESAPSARMNIKALMSHEDWFADLDPELVSSLDAEEKRDPRSVRRRHAGGNGTVLIYPINRNSVPSGVAVGKGTRRPLDAPQDIIGIGLIFPDVDRKGFAEAGDYYSVKPDWEVYAEDEEDDLPEDTEGFAGTPEELENDAL